MLTRQQAIIRYDFSTGRAIPDRLTAKFDRGYLAYADRMLAIYRKGTGRTRRDLHQDVQAIFTDVPECPLRRIQAFCKLLDNASDYRRGDPKQVAALRREVFRAASAMHPLVECRAGELTHTLHEARRLISRSLGRSWPDIERELYSDVFDLHRLESFAGYGDGRALLSRYNVAQQQAALFDAVSMTVRATQDFKTILRYAKLARLMHTISVHAGGGYTFRFNGPASVLRGTTRYGTAFAKFLPALIACRGWSLEAILKRGNATLRLELSAEDGFKSPLPGPAEFDSSVEEKFATSWGAEPRDGWKLIREGEVLSAGQKTFVPDFVLEHVDGRRALLEIVGFWTPEYLAAKLKTLHAFRSHRILLAVAARNEAILESLPNAAIVYKSSLKVADVLERLSAFT